MNFSKESDTRREKERLSKPFCKDIYIHVYCEESFFLCPTKENRILRFKLENDRFISYDIVDNFTDNPTRWKEDRWSSFRDV